MGDGVVVVATRGSGSGGADRRLAAAECILKLPYLKQPLYFKSVYLMARSIRSSNLKLSKSLVFERQKSRGEDHELFLSGGFTRDAAPLERSFLKTIGSLDPECIVAERAKTQRTWRSHLAAEITWR